MKTWTESGFETVAAVVSRRTGLSFDKRQESAEVGMRRAMARARVRDPRQYADRVAADEEAFDDLLTELTVGETYFFREPGHFQFIRQRIIPEIRAGRGDRHVMRVWSAACASGEEAYSLAILFEQLGLAEETSLVGSDISRVALAKARRALYSEWSLRGDGAADARPFLTPAGKNYQLAERVRSRVRFVALNLALDVFSSFAAGIWGMDLILCRNVLIYFDKETVRRTAQRLYHSMADGGWLVTASSDPPLWDFAPFEVVAGSDGLFYRKPGGVSFQAPVLGGAPVEWPAAGPPDSEAVTGDAPAEVSSPFGDSRGPLAQDSPVAASASEAVDAAVHRVRALANHDPPSAAEACVQAIGRHPLSVELHYLHAVLLLDGDRTEDAAQAMRRVIYLDRTSAVAHFTLGAILRRRGDVPGACRAYRNARDLCAARPADEPVPMADGEPAGRLAEAAAAELAILNWKEGGA